MIIYYSGAGSPWLAERYKLLGDDSVMLSYWSYVNQKTGKLETRMKYLLNAKKKNLKAKEEESKE